MGRGGTGVMYQATNIYLRKPGALKVLHRHLFDQPGAKARFLREAAEPNPPPASAEALHSAEKIR